MPLELKKKKWEIYFPIIISTTFAHIELLPVLKFDILMCYRNIQVEFEFGSRLMIFDRVVPLELKSKN